MWLFANFKVGQFNASIINLRIRINCQSVKKKGRDLEALTDSTDPDIILGSESWMNNK